MPGIFTRSESEQRADNGALAEPWTNASRGPKNSMTTMIAAGQNFFRTRMKVQSPFTMLIDTRSQNWLRKESVAPSDGLRPIQ